MVGDAGTRLDAVSVEAARAGYSELQSYDADDMHPTALNDESPAAQLLSKNSVTTKVSRRLAILG